MTDQSSPSPFRGDRRVQDLARVAIILFLALVVAPLIIILFTGGAAADTPNNEDAMAAKKADMKDKLSAEQYYVCFEKGTEPAFSGKYYKTKTPGMYHCVACGEALFSSETKFDSGSGWPAFWEPVANGAVNYTKDTTYGMIRTEATCAKCGAHLGHVFDDGPKPTGQRYCINSVALELVPSDSAGADSHTDEAMHDTE